MRADVTSLDWTHADSGVEPAKAKVKSVDQEQRGAGRVQVKLRVAIDSRDCAYLAESVDISETGVLVDNYEGPNLCPGSMVRVAIQGVIADEDTDGQYSEMYVVRVDGSSVGLSFHRPRRHQD